MNKHYETPKLEEKNITLTPKHKLIGIGGEVQESDYTRSKLDDLAKLHTPSVFAIDFWCSHNQPDGFFRYSHCWPEMARDARTMRQKADVLNERIDADTYGGTGGGEPGIPELPAIKEDRVDLENAATRACTFVLVGAITSAHQAIKDGLAAIEKRGLDTPTADGVE